MPLKTWMVRFLVAFLVAAALLLVVQVLKGNPVQSALAFGAGWGALAAAVFTGVGYAKYRRSPACMSKRPSGQSGAA
jgi:hypothetical protein